MRGRAEGEALEDGLILAVDLGSSSARAALYTRRGERLDDTVHSLSYEPDVTRDGGASKDAEELFGLFAGAIDGAMERAGSREVSAVAVCTFWHSLLGVDDEGKPTTPVFTWADRRSAPCADELRRRLDSGNLHQRTGCVPHSSYLPAKLLWLSREAPEDFARTRRWISPGEYFYSRLFGGDGLRASVSMASATGLMRQNDKVWDEQTLEALPIEELRLSPISDEPLRGLPPEYARRWPALEDALWFPALGDGACSNVGVGCATSGRAALMVGTSGAMRVLWKSDSVEIPEGLWCYRPDAERFVMGGALSDGGNLVAWLQNTLRLPPMEEAEAEISGREPDSHGLDFLPLLAGERGPEWSDLANGAITGLSMASTPTDILHAAMEAVALRFALISRRIESSLPPDGERPIIATGGGLTNSPAWTRMMADALGRPITASAIEEASSRGAALLASEKLGGPAIEETTPPTGDTVEPDERRHQIYRQALQRQTDLYESLVGRG